MTFRLKKSKLLSKNNIFTFYLKPIVLTLVMYKSLNSKSFSGFLMFFVRTKSFISYYIRKHFTLLYNYGNYLIFCITSERINFFN